MKQKTDSRDAKNRAIGGKGQREHVTIMCSHVRMMEALME